MSLRPPVRAAAIAALLALPAFAATPAQAFVTRPAVPKSGPEQVQRHTLHLSPPIRYAGTSDRTHRLRPAAGSSIPMGYIPCDLYNAYGLPPSSTAGSGQLIAIIDPFHQPNIASDLHAFDMVLGVADPPSFTVYQPWGIGSPIPTSWSDEISLDVEYAHAMAPGASIALVEAHDDGLTLPAPPPPGVPGQLPAAIWFAVAGLGADVVSMSFGGPEGAFTAADITTLNTFTPLLNRFGRMVTYLASTGDLGFGDANLGTSTGPFAPEWPALAPGVVGVGGTSVAPGGFGYTSMPLSHTMCSPTLTPGVNSSNETVWFTGCFTNGTPPPPTFCVGTGGGPSRFVGKPAWQSMSPASTRSTPDVAMLADPATGVAWLNSTTNGASTPWGGGPIGGTSLAAPLWAGVGARLDQARRAANMPGLGVTPSNSWVYSASAGAYNDIITGSSPGASGDPCLSSLPANSCAAQAGYDMVTGRGSPNLTQLQTDLVQPANTHAYFMMYDNNAGGVLNDNLHLVNPSGTRVFGTASLLGGTGGLIDFVIEPNSASVLAYPLGTVGGAVDIRSTSRVIASQRVQFNQSFNEVPAQTIAAADTHLFVTWYDHISNAGFLNGADNIVVFNPSVSSTAHVTVHIPGFPACDSSTPILAGSEQAFGCLTGFGGPATITSDVPVLGSSRVIYFGTFNEVIAQPLAGAQTTAYFTWYDHASSFGFVNDNIHVVNPSATTPAHVHVDVVGCTPPDQDIPSGGFGIFACPFGQGFGGPVKITSLQPVLSSQRVQYFQSFNEVNSMAPGSAATTLYMPWYDHASSFGFLNDNVHVINPASSGSVHVTVTIPGCSPPPQDIAFGTFGIFACPFGSGFGGPVVIQSSGNVLASQRVQFFQSFNEAAAQA